MPLVETLPVGADTAQWPLWSTVARIVVTDRRYLAAARSLVDTELATIDQAASRFRADSELVGLTSRPCGPHPGAHPGAHPGPHSGPRDGRPLTVLVSLVLADLIRTALAAAEATDGDVDPTLGDALVTLGYDRDLALLRPASGADWPGRTVQAGPAAVRVSRPVAAWRRISLDGQSLSLPAGVHLDLGATAKAAAADRCAALVAEQLGVGVLVSLGGDLATAGPAPDGWSVLVQDRPGDPPCTVAIPAGAALATSSTVSRTWADGPARRHHIVDPTTGLPAEAVWRTVTVAAHSCVQANTATTAAVVRGRRALPWLRELGHPARLVGRDGDVVTVGGWPREEEAA